MNVFREIRLADVFSLLNGLSGFCAILAAFNGNLELSVLFVMISVVADGLDGFLARRTKAGQLGAGLDSLSDLISFGVAPAVLVINAAEMSPMVLAASMIYLTCGILRLARFNVTAENNKSFEGIPITASGLIVACGILFQNPHLSLFLLLVLAALMVSSIPYPKVRDVRVIAAFFLMLLASAYLMLFGEDNALSAILILTAMSAYVASPVMFYVHG